MNIDIALISKQGDRASNQDQTGELIGQRSACFLVCDGVAGFPGGEVAAKLARNTILNRFNADRHLNAQSIRGFIGEANQVICRAQNETAEYSRMGTTLVGLFIDRDYELAWWVHAGDSRLYQFRRGCLREVTADHSLIQQMRDAGHSTEGINSNLLYYALGMSEEVSGVTYSDVASIEDGDAFLLCTDGFWNGVTARQMEQSLQMVNTPDEWLTLMRQIIAGQPDDKQDNYSALAVWIGSPPDITLLHSLAGTAEFIPFRT
ncbi:PP2C family protein-serine/threonine phosphatase [Kalamiella sp. sgz302252]|uniref:PP2C family protein-serine/threonine phosphatase n=1 Tax=Pantoea sp. sgz302252 TaxID=3341827 RepID=UPI0036D435EF